MKTTLTRTIRGTALRVLLPVAGVLMFALLVATAGLAASPTTERVSVSSSGGEGNGPSSEPPISADGRFIAFSSAADNLAAGDTNHTYDIFVRDEQRGATTRVSVSTAGDGADDLSYRPAISADGRFIAFVSAASNLAPVDSRAYYNVFLHDQQAGTTKLVSESESGSPGNGESNHPSLSTDGRFVAFSSDATNLVAGRTVHPAHHEFVRDMQSGKVERIDVSSKGAQGNGACHNPSISADGRFVAYSSGASNLVRGDTNHTYDIFIRDRKQGRTTRVSVSSTGRQSNGVSFHPSISPDGRFVTFESKASNLVPHDTNRTTDVFVHDRKTGKTQRVSISSGGAQGNGASVMPSISSHAGWVAFYSAASNLVLGDHNRASDAFVHDVRSGTTTRVSVGPGGAEANGSSFESPPVPPSISADGRFVAFASGATNLVPGDTNGTSDIFLRGPLHG